MADTTVAVLTNSVHTKYNDDFIKAQGPREVWTQLVNWKPVSQKGDGASSFTFNGINKMDNDDVAALLPEDTDIEATALQDYAMTVTPKEYGRAVTRTSLLAYQAFIQGGIDPEIARIVGINKVETIEKAIRRGALGGTHTYMPNSLLARTDLDATNDLVTYARLIELRAIALSMGVEPIDSEGNIAAIIPALLEGDILGLTEVKTTGYTQKSDIIFNGEIAKLAGFRFIRSPLSKLYHSGGTVAQAATTLTAASAAGATTLLVTAGTGLGNGDYITIGTLEGAKTETVRIVSGGTTTTLTVRGIGNGAANTGCRWAHENGAAVTEAAFAAAILVCGRESLKGVFGKEWGKGGMPTITGPFDKLGRFKHFGWLWYGGIGVVQSKVLRGEFACSMKTIGVD